MGWKYRGRGIFQLTFHDNYAAAGKALGLDLVANPALAAIPANAVRIAGWYWNGRNLSDIADLDGKLWKDEKGNLAITVAHRITKLINGGFNGIDSRLALLAKCKAVLTQKEPPPVVVKAEVKS